MPLDPVDSRANPNWASLPPMGLEERKSLEQLWAFRKYHENSIASLDPKKGVGVNLTHVSPDANKKLYPKDSIASLGHIQSNASKPTSGMPVLPLPDSIGAVASVQKKAAIEEAVPSQSGYAESMYNTLRGWWGNIFGSNDTPAGDINADTSMVGLPKEQSLSRNITDKFYASIELMNTAYNDMKNTLGGWWGRLVGTDQANVPAVNLPSEITINKNDFEKIAKAIEDMSKAINQLIDVSQDRIKELRLNGKDDEADILENEMNKAKKWLSDAELYKQVQNAIRAEVAIKDLRIKVATDEMLGSQKEAKAVQKDNLEMRKETDEREKNAYYLGWVQTAADLVSVGCLIGGIASVFLTQGAAAPWIAGLGGIAGVSKGGAQVLEANNTSKIGENNARRERNSFATQNLSEYHSKRTEEMTKTHDGKCKAERDLYMLNLQKQGVLESIRNMNVLQ